jgi:hypothetical protein
MRIIVMFFLISSLSGFAQVNLEMNKFGNYRTERDSLYSSVTERADSLALPYIHLFNEAKSKPFGVVVGEEELSVIKHQSFFIALVEKKEKGVIYNPKKDVFEYSQKKVLYEKRSYFLLFVVISSILVLMAFILELVKNKIKGEGKLIVLLKESILTLILLLCSLAAYLFLVIGKLKCHNVDLSFIFLSLAALLILWLIIEQKFNKIWFYFYFILMGSFFFFALI